MLISSFPSYQPVNDMLNKEPILTVCFLPVANRSNNFTFPWLSLGAFDSKLEVCGAKDIS